MHRAMDILLAILKLGTVGKAQRGCFLELFTCASGIGPHLKCSGVEICPCRMSWTGARRVRGVERPLHGGLTAYAAPGRLGRTSTRPCLC